MLKRTLRLSTIILCIFCTFFLICTGVFAASRQASQISTTVQFTPGILAKVFVSVDGGSTYELIFNNTGTGSDSGRYNNQGEEITPRQDANKNLLPPYFVISGNNANITGITSATPIQFIIENHNETGNIKAEVFYADEHKGWYFADVNGDEYTTITKFDATTPSTVIQTETITPTNPTNSKSTNTFHIISLFDNLYAKLVIKLTDVPAQ